MATNNNQSSLNSWLVRIGVPAIIVLLAISAFNTCDGKRTADDINNKSEKNAPQDSVAISAVMGVQNAVNKNTEAVLEVGEELGTIASNVYEIKKKMDSCLDCGQTQYNKNNSQKLKRKKMPSSPKPETAPVAPTSKPQPDTIKVPKDTVVPQNSRPEVGGCTVSVTSRNIGGDVNAAIAELRRRQSYER